MSAKRIQLTLSAPPGVCAGVCAGVRAGSQRGRTGVRVAAVAERLSTCQGRTLAPVQSVAPQLHGMTVELVYYKDMISYRNKTNTHCWSSLVY
jgi:hypothetical protein